MALYLVKLVVVPTQNLVKLEVATQEPGKLCITQQAEPELDGDKQKRIPVLNLGKLVIVPILNLKIVKAVRVQALEEQEGVS